ncbi:Ran guanine nucleotide release factor [Babesia caballi]|uniref:Ran guanine nucleotide release factor n=1 Tax=Babesia caballi TaxID=5871 RepID=A0AAV4LQC5_BABCB|nr:Ran guanine nucleotide release factor [Babesia caballi]
MIGTIRHLYGGAIVCRIPSEFQDLSNFLPIPDHQEVFVYHLSNTHLQKNSRTPRESDCVLSFEILEYLTNEDDASLARHLFEDLASCNEAAHNEVKTYEQMIVPSSLGYSCNM